MIGSHVWQPVRLEVGHIQEHTCIIEYRFHCLPQREKDVCVCSLRIFVDIVLPDGDAAAVAATAVAVVINKEMAHSDTLQKAWPHIAGSILCHTDVITAKYIVLLYYSQTERCSPSALQVCILCNRIV